jgi:hypothetical protein
MRKKIRRKRCVLYRHFFAESENDLRNDAGDLTAASRQGPKSTPVIAMAFSLSSLQHFAAAKARQV